LWRRSAPTPLWPLCMPNAPIGERAFFKVPRNHDKNTTLLCSLRAQGVGSSMAVEGATTREVFEAYVEHFLAPTLKPGQVVIMDNLGAHRPKRLKELIEGRGCELIYLPPYSPGLQPYRGSLLKDRAYPQEDRGPYQKGSDRSDGSSIGIRGRDVRGFFAHCGYRTPAHRL
jgi:transposase